MVLCTRELLVEAVIFCHYTFFHLGENSQEGFAVFMGLRGMKMCRQVEMSDVHHMILVCDIYNLKLYSAPVYNIS